MEITQKDVEKLKIVRVAIDNGTATTVEKNACLQALDAIISPKCAVCRLPLEDYLIINERKFHPACSKRYAKTEKQNNYFSFF